MFNEGKKYLEEKKYFEAQIKFNEASHQCTDNYERKNIFQDHENETKKLIATIIGIKN